MAAGRLDLLLEVVSDHYTTGVQESLLIYEDEYLTTLLQREYDPFLLRHILLHLFITYMAFTTNSN